jgi:hypothetical protein
MFTDVSEVPAASTMTASVVDKFLPDYTAQHPRRKSSLTNNSIDKLRGAL